MLNSVVCVIHGIVHKLHVLLLYFSDLPADFCVPNKSGQVPLSHDVFLRIPQGITGAELFTGQMLLLMAIGQPVV